MTWTLGLRLIVASLLLAIGGRFLVLQYETWDQRKYTEEICNVVGNYLEVGSLREAYEGLQQSLFRHGKDEACVSVTDNGRSFSPNCLDTSRSYVAFQCKTEANKGVKAQIFYPAVPFFGLVFWELWLLIIAVMVMTFEIFRLLTSRLTEKFTDAIQNRLFTQSTATRPGLMTRIADWSLAKTGISERIRFQTKQFENQLHEFELRVREEAALRAREAAEAHQSKEYFARVRQIRHDIRSPLTALMAVMESFQGSEAKRKSLAATIKHIQGMVDDLGQIEKAKDEPELTIVEVLAEETVARLRPRFRRAKQVTLSLEYDSSRLSPVTVVPDGLRRVLDNLLENSFDAVQLRGRIKVSVSCEKSFCEIRVEDNGCGVDPKVLPIIFTKDESIGKINGTGLGLHHCRQSVLSWNGQIRCEPLPEGTRFVIQLPLTQTGISYLGLSGFSRVMVIDDDPTIAQALRQSGFDVVQTAKDFEEGKELLKAPHDESLTILVDEHLGHGHLGSDLLAEYMGNMSIYLCTNDYTNPEVIARARRIGARILPKPLCFFDSQRRTTAAILRPSSNQIRPK